MFTPSQPVRLYQGELSLENAGEDEDVHIDRHIDKITRVLRPVIIIWFKSFVGIEAPITGISYSEESNCPVFPLRDRSTDSQAKTETL